MFQLTSLRWPTDQGQHRCWVWGSRFSAPPTHVLDRTLFLPLGFLAPIQVGSRCFWLSLDRQGGWGNESPEDGSVSLGGVNADMVWGCRRAGPWGGEMGEGASDLR